MSVLVLGHHNGSALSPATASVVAAARKIGADIDVLLVGHNLTSIASEAAQLAGARKVLLAESADLAEARATDISDIMFAIADPYSTFLSAANALGKSAMPRLAAKLDVQQITEITAILGPDTFERPIYAGNAIETVKTGQIRNVITVRTTSFEAAAKGGEAVIEHLSPLPSTGAVKLLRTERDESDRPKLDEARIVVSGGVSLGSAAEFERLVYPLADKLSAAVGASRAAVDEGFVPNECQVGQTGKVVAPELYIACGISGAIQHVAGMRGAKVIVAINSDPEAPIVKLADYALVADLFEAVPELTEKL
ncbi:MAG: electron transfer flavoprotein subunit alpha/FixB family protein [Hyphomicrobiaceae bacterium]|nr:electron transfer flavoprotein subunit alpha/FixB family protein [Hyphomicrobiaceae bacterium]MCC0024663.1 electron transfer flavoprotein subunit alpha/FixB family protein [Hyphomicrobiaceae bacterium]